MSDPMHHYANIIKKRAELLAWEFRRAHGDFDRLDGRITDGCWAAQGSLPIMDLTTAETELRALADSIKARREQMIANRPKVAA